MKCASQHQHQIPPWMPNLQLRGKTLLQIGRQSLMDLSSLWDNWVKNHSSWRKSWGLLTVQGVLIELSKKSTRVAQVHGSITGKNVLQIIQSVKDRKEKRGTPEKKRLEKSKKIKKEIFFFLLQDRISVWQWHLCCYFTATSFLNKNLLRSLPIDLQVFYFQSKLLQTTSPEFLFLGRHWWAGTSPRRNLFFLGTLAWHWKHTSEGFQSWFTYSNIIQLFLFHCVICQDFELWFYFCVSK